MAFFPTVGNYKPPKSTTTSSPLTPPTGTTTTTIPSTPSTGAPNPLTSQTPTVPSPFQMLSGQLGMYQMFGQPQIDQFNLQNEQLRRQLGVNQSFQGLQEDLLRSNYGLGMEELGVARQGQGVDRGYIGQQFGFNDRDLGLALQLLGLDEEEARHRADLSTRQAESRAVAAGAWNLPGVANQRADIQSLLGRQLAGVETRRGQAGLGYEREAARLEHELSGLDLAGDRLGIDAKKLGSALNFGLARTGMEGVVNQDEIWNAIFSNDIQKQMAGMTILQSALQSMPPEVLAQLDQGDLQRVMEFLNTGGVAAPAPSRVGFHSRAR